MFNIRNLVIKNTTSEITLVSNLSFIASENSKIAIIGTEGSGKTTLLRVLNNDIPSYISVSGNINRPSNIGYLPQDINKAYGKLSVNDFLFNDLDYEILKDCITILKKFNLSYSEIEKRIISSFSGGEKVKIALCKILVSNPSCILLDEPSNDLDFETIIFLEEFLISTDIPVIFVSHDQRLLENVSTSIIHLQQTKHKTDCISYYKGIGYLEYKIEYNKKYNKDLVIASKERANYAKKMEKFRQIYQKVEYRQNQAVRDPVTSRLLKKRIHVLKSQQRRYLKEQEEWTEIPEKEEPLNIFFSQKSKINQHKILLEINLDNFTLPNNKTIDNISLSISAVDKLVIFGNNGIGKTTFLKYIKEELTKNNIKVGYISQNYEDILDYDCTIVEFLDLKQDMYNVPKVRQILGNVGFHTNEMTVKIRNISEGQKLKLLLVLLISSDFDILLLDEPTRNISPLNLDEVYSLFNSFIGSIVAITHDRSFIENVFDNIYCLTEKGLILQ
ncbi:MAG: ATP-binding cassette domain-containing protein [Acholeplasmatales bacterium]|jgi:ATPase subunit of ABC transporter with duplicated ATPase domains|nr:ATP-binding cassette domain-containing protein [Acholeplasmatales bacterium]